MKPINHYLFALVFHPKLRALRRLQFIAAIIIFAYMALSTPPQELVALSSDKVLHLLGNILLISSTWLAFAGTINKRLSLLFAVCYSLLIEGLQYFTLLRQADPTDALTNLLGIFVGFCLCLLLEYYLKSTHRPNEQS